MQRGKGGAAGGDLENGAVTRNHSARGGGAIQVSVRGLDQVSPGNAPSPPENTCRVVSAEPPVSILKIVP